MERMWFVYVNNKISGPLSTADAEAELDQARELGKGLIWWRGQSEWIPKSRWQKEAALAVSKPATNNFYLDINGETVIGPFALERVCEQLQPVQDLDNVRVWSDHTQRWQSAFEIGEICESLGLQRRANSRVPLAGSAIVERDNAQFIAPVTSVSIGGVGLRLESAPRISGTVTLTLRSSSLFNIIKTKAEVAYQKGDGSIGLRFLALSAENQSAIIEYVRSFEMEAEKTKAA